MHDPALSTELLSSLQGTIKTQSMLLAKSEQREARMQAEFEQRMQSLQHEVGQAQQRIEAITRNASSEIARQARESIAPITADYGRSVSNTCNQLRQTGRMLWLWLGAAVGTLLAVLLVGWALLGYYRREISANKEELQRYENAVPIVKAFYGSDIELCGDRLCANVDPRGHKSGDKGQYQPVRSRPQP